MGGGWGGVGEKAQPEEFLWRGVCGRHWGKYDHDMNSGVPLRRLSVQSYLGTIWAYHRSPFLFSMQMHE